MWDARSAFGILWLRRHSPAFVGALALWLGLCALDLALARAANDGRTSAEAWALSQLKQDKLADFNQRCGAEQSPLEPSNEDVSRWWDDCRKLSARFVKDLLTLETAPSAGVQIEGARITENIDLENAKLLRPMVIRKSQIEGEINMLHARTERLISFEGSLIGGEFKAGSLYSTNELSLARAAFKEIVNLNGAKIAGLIDMTGARFNSECNADFLRAESDLFMNSSGVDKVRFKKLRLRGAKISGQVDMTGAGFDDTLEANSLVVGGDLKMLSDETNTASFKEVDLTAAQIAGDLDMTGANFGGKLDAETLQVGGDLKMLSDETNTASFKEVDLTAAKIIGDFDMTGGNFNGKIDGTSFQVGGDLIIKSDETNTASFKEVDLTDAKIGGDLQLLGLNSARQPWTLHLRYTQVDTVVDNKDAWPVEEGQLELDGFSFNHFGGPEGDAEGKLLERGTKWWDEWARRDSQYSPTPYQQLAAAFASAGDHTTANEIRFLGRERELDEAWKRGQWARGLFLFVLGSIAGYGIGIHTFHVLYWVLGFWFLGATVLFLWVPKAGEEFKSNWLLRALWCFGASLARLLPVIELKEFKAFFEDPDKAGLKMWQRWAFSFLGLVGWILAAILGIAVAGLIQDG